MLNALRVPGAGLSITGFSSTVSPEKDEKGLSAASSGEGIAPRRCTQHLLPVGHSPLWFFVFFLVHLVQLSLYLCRVGWQEKSGRGGGFECMALAWNGDVPLVGVTGAIILCHAVETSVLSFAPYISTTFPYHLSFSARLSLDEGRDTIPIPLPPFRRNVCWDVVNKRMGSPLSQLEAKETCRYPHLETHFPVLPWESLLRRWRWEENREMDWNVNEVTTYLAGACFA